MTDFAIPDRPGWHFLSLPRGLVHPIKVRGGVGLTYGCLYVFVAGAALAVTNPMLRWHGPVREAECGCEDPYCPYTHPNRSEAAA